MERRLVQPAEEVDRACPVAPLPVPDRLHRAEQERTVGVGSSYLELEDRAWALETPLAVQVGTVTARDRVDMLEGIRCQIYRPSVDMVRTGYILLQGQLGHSYLTYLNNLLSFDHLKWLVDDSLQFRLTYTAKLHCCITWKVAFYYSFLDVSDESRSILL